MGITAPDTFTVFEKSPARSRSVGTVRVAGNPVRWRVPS